MPQSATAVTRDAPERRSAQSIASAQSIQSERSPSDELVVAANEILAARACGRISKCANEQDSAPAIGAIRLAGDLAQQPAAEAVPLPNAANEPGSILVDPAPVPVSEQPADRYPITLATALFLAGSSNLQVAIAQERVREAYAKLDGAKVLWVPNISGGVGFNDHAGQLQNIEGRILEINRQSLFVGGGAGFGRTPLAGGANPPPRMGIDLSPVDVIFEPLSARQSVNRSNAEATAIFNDTLLDVSLVYLELVRSQAQVAIAQETLANSRELESLTSEFARAGAGLEADAQRARADLAERERELLAAEERVRVCSAELARLLHLDQSVILFALETQPVPLTLISTDVSLASLTAQGVNMRPELARDYAQAAAAENRVSQERWRPWVPSLHVGIGGGTFGGGRNSDFGDFSGRYDLDALAVWEMRNMGFGNRALVRQRASEHRQACLTYQQSRDQIAADIAAAYHQSQLRIRQIEFAEQQIAAAADALPLNFNGIRGRELRPIEAQQAIAGLAAARNRYVNSVIEYNQAQLSLWRAVGHPPDASAAIIQQ
jgi:outer membrane protein TolC